MDDLELLRQYSREGSQAAFSALVARHVDMVYSAARRQVWSPELAEEVTQAVFLDLARNAGKLRSDSHLGSWLYVVARRTSVDAIRRESRRQKREQAGLEGAALNTPSVDWSAIEPLLDEAVISLNNSDRQVVLLRFFEKRNFAEIGRALGTSEQAAQKRAARALDRLRKFLGRRGAPTSAAALAAAIAPRAVQAAPTGLAVSVSSAVALLQPTLQQAAIFQSAHTLAMTFAQKTAATVLIAAALAGGLYQASIIRNQAHTLVVLNQQLESSQERIRQLNREHNAAANTLAALRQQNGKLKTEGPDETSNDPTAVALRSWLVRVSQLKQRLEEKPDQKIPELQFLTADDWLAAARANLTTDDDYRHALSNLRNSATGKFVGMIGTALHKYSQANNRQFPADLSQLQPYFESPVSAEVLQRYAIVPQSTMPYVTVSGKGDQIIAPKSVVDEELDMSYVVGARGSGASSPQAANTAIRAMMRAYMAANNGQPPSDPAQLLPFATTPEQQTALQRAIRNSSGN